MTSNQVTAIGVWIIAIGVIAVGGKYGIKEYKNLYWKNNPNVSTFNDIDSRCKKIFDNVVRGYCIESELRDRGLTEKEYNAYVEWYNSKLLGK